jgi:hypothetical protein
VGTETSLVRNIAVPRPPAPIHDATQTMQTKGQSLQ